MADELLQFYRRIANAVTDEEKCEICGQFKPVNRVRDNNGRQFESLEDYSIQWRWNIFASGRLWHQVCPDCVKLFKLGDNRL